MPNTSRCQQLDSTLSPLAATSQGYLARYREPLDERPPYQRDIDRILHSKAYARYVDKTQVAYLLNNDHICQRSLHVQLVNTLARRLARALNLNIDLVEAIALGHDVGHPPFGHEGEEYLSDLSQQHGAGPFTHPYQSCRLLTKIEPLNLGLAVLDGILCHDGGMPTRKLTPNNNKNWDLHDAEWKEKAINPNHFLTPMTLEACLVKLCDTVSYLSRDLEDAILLHIIDRHAIPTTPLGRSNDTILGTFSKDLLSLSKGQNYLELSPNLFEGIAQLRAFNFDRIYCSKRLKTESDKICKSYKLLFEHLLEDLIMTGAESHVARTFLEGKTEHYLASTTAVQQVIDYIAGMTDGYFLRTFKKLLVPSSISWPTC